MVHSLYAALTCLHVVVQGGRYVKLVVSAFENADVWCFLPIYVNGKVHVKPLAPGDEVPIARAESVPLIRCDRGRTCVHACVSVHTQPDERRVCSLQWLPACRFSTCSM